MPPQQLTRLQTRNEVPAVILEPFLQNAYRPLGLGLKDSILSCTTWMSNETLNVWTHLIPAAWYFWLCGQLVIDVLQAGRDIRFFMPLIVFQFGCGHVLLTSSIAHCLNCMSARARHTCFFCDYGAIGFYGLASALAHYSYSNLLPSDEPTDFGRWLLSTPLFHPIVFALSQACLHTLVFWSSCMTRHHWRSLRFVIRTGNYIVAFNANMVPFWLRCFFSTTTVFWTNTFHYSFWQYALNAMAAVANVTKFPERLYPGRFDKIGHSHQWMHLFVVAGIWCELESLKVDIRTRHDELVESPFQLPFALSVALPLALCAYLTGHIVHLYRRLKENGDLRSQKND